MFQRTDILFQDEMIMNNDSAASECGDTTFLPENGSPEWMKNRSAVPD